MSTHVDPHHVAHHFDDSAQQFDAARLGMWVFLATEILFFGGLFTGYTIYRMAYPAAFAEGSSHLDLVLGTLNTAVLLCSSFSIAMAVHSIQLDRTRHAVRFLVATIVLGAVFLGIKAYEYNHKFHENLVPGPNFALGEDVPPEVDPRNVQVYFSFYFAMTGMHAVHMVIGMGLLAMYTIKTHRGRFSSRYFTPIEMMGLYWHFVDIVWVFLFPLLYLIG